VAEEFEAATKASSRRVCYLGADDLLARVYADSPDHSTLVVGAQPILNPQRWGHIIGGHASLRAQLNRARNKSVEVHQWFAEHATNHPELEHCLAEWLGARGLPPLHFLVEPDTLGQLQDRMVFVAQRDGRVIGFLVASPIALQKGWQIEQLVREPHAPNGTTELLMDGAIRSLATAGVTYVALGAAPLSEKVALGKDTPTRVRAVLRWQRAHAKRFYNFEGLESFKAKFEPERWDPVYAISCEPRFSLTTLYAIAGAYSGRSPIRAFTQALGRAVRQEFSWLWSRVKRRVDQSDGRPIA
jgi:phosphatidylglycerol lysyltransferase